MQVVRKRLSEREGAPPDTRYNPDCDCVETSVDGGMTWTQNDGADPRKNPAYQQPPNTAPDVRCAAAAGMVEDVRRVVNAGIAGVGTVGVGAILLTIVVIPFFWAYLLITLIASLLLLIGSSALAAAFTTEVYDGLLCMFYDNIDTDGRIDESGFAAVQSAAAGEWSSAAIDGALAIVLQLHGIVGLNNAGVVYADPDAECVCDTWCYVLDLAISDGGWTPYGAGQGHWESGVGLVADNVVVGVQRTIMQGTLPLGGTADITNIAMNYDWFAGTIQPGVAGLGGAFNDFAENWANIDMNAMSDGSNQLVDVPAVASIYNIFIDLQCSHSAYGGSATALVLTLRGNGDPPTFLESNGWVAC